MYANQDEWNVCYKSQRLITGCYTRRRTRNCTGFNKKIHRVQSLETGEYIGKSLNNAFAQSRFLQFRVQPSSITKTKFFAATLETTVF